VGASRTALVGGGENLLAAMASPARVMARATGPASNRRRVSRPCRDSSFTSRALICFSALETTPKLRRPDQLLADQQ